MVKISNNNNYIFKSYFIKVVMTLLFILKSYQLNVPILTLINKNKTKKNQTK